MQSVRSRIWTRVAVSISCDDNHYTTGTSIFSQPLRSGEIWHKVNFCKRSLTGLNSEFFFSLTSCLTKAEKRSLPYYLLIAGGRITGFIPFPSILVLCEMQSVRSRIWTRVAVSISCDNNNYTTGTSFFSQPLRSGRIWHKVNFCKRSLTGFNSEFSFS